jgi:hypothetical protein
MTSRNEWQRVSRSRPCRICEKPDWCLVSADLGAAICARIESAKRCGEAGWLHRLRDEVFRPARRVVRSVAHRPAEPRHDLADVAAGYRHAVNPDQLGQLAHSLGLSADSLTALQIGWSSYYRAWSFPMLDASANVLGIRLRRSDGSKFAVTGSKEGLFVPTGERADSMLLVCEGPTDTAALLDMGFRNVVGRPNCTGGVKLLVKLVRRRLRPEVVILADGDEAGRRGADNLLSVLLLYAPAVRVIRPPEGIKDARAWLLAGGTRTDIQQAIAAAPARRLVIQARHETERRGAS